MEPRFMQQRPGRLGEKINYDNHDRVMPDLPQRAREAREWIFKEIKDPGVLTMKPRKRWRIDGPALPVRFTREEGHFALNNVCTLPRLHMLPGLRRLQCWYLPRLAKIDHGPNYHPTPLRPRRRRAHTIMTRPHMWQDIEKFGRWDLSRELETESAIEANWRENVFHDKCNTQQFYKSHAEAIEAWRKEYRKYWYRERTPPKVVFPPSNLRRRKWDLDELQKLEEWTDVKTYEPQSLHNSDFVPTSVEGSDGEDYSGHGDNQSSDDWWGC